MDRGVWRGRAGKEQGRKKSKRRETEIMAVLPVSPSHDVYTRMDIAFG
jgi:hypothetical protein